MGQGNPNKVNAIVDEIVKSNSVFKLKSPIEQDKEKDSMARSINSALSVLNEVGKELVLQDLSVDPDEKFKGFIDSVGNIDISGLTKMTATIVKAKIEEAEREGLNLRTGEPVFKNDSKISVVEGVLTIAVVNEMIINYENLTDKEKSLLFDDNVYMSMSDDTRKKLNEKVYEEATRKNLSKEERKKVEESKRKLDLNEAYIEIMKQYPKFTFEKIIAEIRKKYPQFSEEEIIKQCKKYHNKENSQKENIDAAKKDSSKYAKDIKLIDIMYTYNCLIGEGKISEAKNYILNNKGIIPDSVWSEIHKNGKFVSFKEYTLEEAKDFQKIHEELSKKEPKVTPKKIEKHKQEIESIRQLEEEIQYTEIEQLPIALAKAGFSQEEIKEALKNYTSLIKEFDEEIIDSIKDKDNNELKEWLKELFDDEEEFPVSENVKKILQQLAQNDFGGHLQQILTNPQLLQETFLPALNAEIEKLEQQPIQDEHTDEYYRSQSETLQVDEEFEKIVKEIQAQGGGVKEITVALAKKVEERATEQSQHSIPEEESKEQKTEQPTPPIFENPTTPEEPTQESATSPEQETLEETGQNMAMVKQDNSFIGKIRRVFANMRDMKNKDNSKGFFARLGASIKTVFGNKEEHYEEQDSSSTAPTTENQSQSTARREPIDYLNQHFEVNESIARKETEKSKEAKDFSNAGDRTTDEEEK